MKYVSAETAERGLYEEGSPRKRGKKRHKPSAERQTNNSTIVRSQSKNSLLRKKAKLRRVKRRTLRVAGSKRISQTTPKIKSKDKPRVSKLRRGSQLRGKYAKVAKEAVLLIDSYSQGAPSEKYGVKNYGLSKTCSETT